MTRKSVQLVVTAAILSLFAASPTGAYGTASTKVTHVPSDHEYHVAAQSKCLVNELRCEVTGVAPLATSNSVGNYTYDGYCVSESAITKKCSRYYDNYGCPTGETTHQARMWCGYWVNPYTGCIQ